MRERSRVRARRETRRTRDDAVAMCVGAAGTEWTTADDEFDVGRR